MKMATFSEDRIGSTAMNDSIDLTALDTVDGTIASLGHDWWWNHPVDGTTLLMEPWLHCLAMASLFITV